MTKITFSNLSTPLKIGIVLAWIIGSIYCTLFALGFLIGLSSVI